MKIDRNETNDLKLKNPEKFKELVDLYNQWAAENVVAENNEEGKDEGKQTKEVKTEDKSKKKTKTKE